MQSQFIVNGDVCLVLTCDNIMEEELIKTFLKQNNIIDEIRNTTVILNKSSRSGLIIGKNGKVPNDKTET